MLKSNEWIDVSCPLVLSSKDVLSWVQKVSKSIVKYVLDSKDLNFLRFKMEDESIVEEIGSSNG